MQPSLARTSAPDSPPVDWKRINAHLDHAEIHAQVGTVVPALARLGGMKRRLARLAARAILALAQVVTRVQRQFNIATLSALRDLRSASRQLNEQMAQEYTSLQSQVLALERRVNLLLEVAQRRMPEPFDTGELREFAAEADRSLDALYVAFEDRFRGSREMIRERLRVYLPLVHKAIDAEPLPVLDLGCGRGEWLALLGDEGVPARGVDSNRVMVSECRQRGLHATLGKGLEYLRGLPDGSLSAVTGFHIIEHLEFETLIKLLDESMRALRPGGLLIFETPNPQNLLVASYSFYFDPTHRHPLPSPLVKFLAEARGFTQLEILALHPFPSEMRLGGSELAERFSDYCYGPRDYAVIGWKPGPRSMLADRYAGWVEEDA
jgi:O-antigen chain-terminating methyltransferase